MANLFQQLKGDLSNVKNDYIGPSYSYAKMIKNPDEMGMSNKGSIPALSKNITAITAYVDGLISGKSSAYRDGIEYLGNRYYLKTGGKCKDYKTNEVVDRYAYVSNVPTGKIPFIDYQAKGLRGIAPGMIDNLMAINPLKLFRGFTQASEPLCAAISLPVITQREYPVNVGSGKTRVQQLPAQYIAKHVPIQELIDLVDEYQLEKEDIPKVTTEMRKALVKSYTQETFENMCTGQLEKDIEHYMDTIGKPKKPDTFTNLYYTSLALFISYILYKVYSKYAR